MNDTLELLPQEAYDFGLMNGLGGIAAALMDQGETVPDIMALRIPKKKSCCGGPRAVMKSCCERSENACQECL